MITVSATIQIDKQTLTAVIQALHPGQPFTIDQVRAFLVKMAIEEYATGTVPAQPTMLVDSSGRYEYEVKRD